MKFSSISLFPVLAIAAACGGSDATTDKLLGDANAADGNTQIPDDQTILTKAYDSNYHVPDGFFVDDRAETTTRSYSLHHVLDESNSYELCTDDLVIAQAWEQADNDSRAVNGYYVASIENERYFEFIRELEYDDDVGNVGDPTSPGYARIFKCEYVDRSGVDRNLREGYSGRLAPEPISGDTFKELVEYLWQFRFFNVSRKAVVASYGDQGAAGPTQTLLLALVVNQGSNRCDRIDVVEWRFEIDSQSGQMSRQFQTIRSFESELRDGVPQFCE